MKQKRKHRGSRKVRKVPNPHHAPKPRKYFGKPSQLMVNTIARSAIKVLRRERRRLRWLISQEYAQVKKRPKKERELSEMDKLVLACQMGMLLNGIMDQEERLR